MTTTYQRCLINAELRKQAYAHTPCWQSEYASEWEGFRAGAERPTEDVALDRLHRHYCRLYGKQTVLEVATSMLRDLLTEHRLARRAEYHAEMTLRDLLARQGHTLEWIDQGRRHGEKSHMIALVVPLPVKLKAIANSY